MKIDPDTGLLDNARQVRSPNCDKRPAGSTIDLIVIHSISLPPGEFGGQRIESFFTNTLNPDEHPYFNEIIDLHVSSHFLLNRTGEICQFVPVSQRAWHAGESCFDGRTSCNDFSVGIELEGTDDQPYEDIQYDTLAGLIKALVEQYPAIKHDHIVGHSDIAPDRKTDPGPAFDWERLRSLV